jgi:hypothetical protein
LLREILTEVNMGGGPTSFGGTGGTLGSQSPFGAPSSLTQGDPSQNPYGNWNQVGSVTQGDPARNQLPQGTITNGPSDWLNYLHGAGASSFRAQPQGWDPSQPNNSGPFGMRDQFGRAGPFAGRNAQGFYNQGNPSLQSPFGPPQSQTNGMPQNPFGAPSSVTQGMPQGGGGGMDFMSALQRMFGGQGFGSATNNQGMMY